MTPHMRAIVRRRVNSRAEVSELSELERSQLLSAGRVLLGARDLESLLAWSDRELLGWLLVRVDDEDGAPQCDAWLLASGDEGLLFEPGVASHLGIAMSQTYLVDVQASRASLVKRLQHALDAMLRPRFLGWVSDEGLARAEFAAEPEEVDELEPALRKA